MTRPSSTDPTADTNSAPSDPWRPDLMHARPGGRDALWQTIALLGALTLLVIAALVVWWVPAMIDRWAAASAQAQANADAALLAGARETITFRAVARKVTPSVVNISAMFPGQSVVVEDRIMGRLYRRRLPGQSGQGSGVIVALSPDGRDVPLKDGQAAGSRRLYVLTNNHVVTQTPMGRDGRPDISRAVPAESLAVDVPTRNRPLPARIVGLDPGADLALLEFDDPDTQGLMPAELGDSENVEVGDLVLAFGSPFGLQHTVTDGIISAKCRTGIAAADGVEFLQTSAAINPGNSGGPLVDMAGRVVGINTAIISPSGVSSGIGLSVPINTVRSSLARMLETYHKRQPGMTDPVRVRRGYIGVQVASLNRLVAESELRQLRLPASGVGVLSVIPGSPASRAGVKPGDIITEFDGQPMSDADAFSARTGSAPVGSIITLGIFRGGQTLTVEVTVGEMLTPDTPNGSSSPSR